MSAVFRMIRSWTGWRVSDAACARRGWLRVAAFAGAAAALAAVGCSREPDGSTPGTTSSLRVVATVAMIGDVAREVAGDRAAVTTLMGEGVDPHLYKASPGDVRLLAQADLILYNGLHLEGRLAEVIERMSSRTKVVRVTEDIPEIRLRRLGDDSSQVDPHAWFDVSLWRIVAARIRDAMIAGDPGGGERFAANALAYQTLLDEVHSYAAGVLASVPPANRLMVTAHDAFGYFGATYGLEVMGIQGLSTDSEASLQDINTLVDTRVSRRVPAVFVESSVPRKTVDALVEGCRARGHALVVGGELFGDAMGPPGTAQGTYVGMMLHNVEAVARALGGVVPDRRPAAIEAYMRRFASGGDR